MDEATLHLRTVTARLTWPAGRFDRAVLVLAPALVLQLPPGTDIDQADSALRWLADHAGEFGLAPDAIDVVGPGAAELARRASESGWPHVDCPTCCSTDEGNSHA